MNNLFKLTMVLLALTLGGQAQAQEAKPNILIIWGDDIGPFNISAYNFQPMIVKVAQFKKTFKEFPQRQKPASFVP